MTTQSKGNEKMTRIRANRDGPGTLKDTQAGLENMDVAALAELYNSPPASRIVHQELLEDARRALAKYELAEDELAIATDSLARSMQLLFEQHGLKKLEPEHMLALERDVLAWCGSAGPTPTSESVPHADGHTINKFPKVTPVKPQEKVSVVPIFPNPLTHHTHGTAHSH